MKNLAVLAFAAIIALGCGDDDPSATGTTTAGPGCSPALSTLCIGDEVYVCQADGSVDPVKTCAAGKCEAGACLEEATTDTGPASSGRCRSPHWAWWSSSRGRPGSP